MTTEAPAGGNSSECLGKKGLGAGGEWVAALGGPGGEEGGEGHADAGAFGGAGAAADLAGDDQRAQAALGEVVVGRHRRVGDEGEQLVEEEVDAAAEGGLGRGAVGGPEGLAERGQPALQGVPAPPARSASARSAAAWRLASR